MIEPKNDLLSRILTDVVAELRHGADAETSWAEAHRALMAAREEDDVELFVAIEDRDFDALQAIVAGWASGERTLTKADRDVLKRALKAFRKRLKVVQLDEESSIGGGAFSSGREASIVGVRPPEQYPQEVWDELVRQKRLVASREEGIYELPPD